MRLNLECKPDEKLAMCLGVIRRNIRHHNDKGVVCNALKNTKNEKGLIDEDPSSAQPKYLSNLKSISNRYGVKEFRDGNNNTILILCPRLEDWLLSACKESKINITTFGLPADPNQLHKEIINKLRKVEELIIVLESLKSPAILHLKSKIL